MSFAASAEIPPIPDVKPVPEDGNLPLGSALFSASMDYGDLARQGYIEQEYFISGKASVRNQETNAPEVSDVPYVSRILVRMPTNPKAFSGNVVIEPFHGMYEKSDLWRQVHNYITRHGDVWVGVTIKAYSLDMEPTSQYALGGVPMLKAYDPVRYGSLDLYPDNRPLGGAPPAPTPPQATDLIAQVATLLKTNASNSPLRGMHVDKLYVIGTGLNGEAIMGYLRTGMENEFTLPDGKPIIDGWMAGATGRKPPPPPPGAAFILLRSENEMDRAATSGFLQGNPDSPSYRIYNVPGTAHLGAKNRPDASASFYQINGVLPKPDLNMPYVLSNSSCADINDEPVDLFVSALLNRMEEWGKHKTALPLAPLPDTLPGDLNAPEGNPDGAISPSDLKVSILKRDLVSGNVVGGVRLPWIEAPIARYPLGLPGVGGPPPGLGAGGPPPSAGPGGPPPGLGAGGPPPTPSDAWPRLTKDAPQLPTKPGRGPCFLFNPRVPLDTTALHTLYKNYDDYVSKFDAAKAKAVQAGWLLGEDAATMRPRGNPADF